MFLYYSNSKATSPADARKITEFELMEQYHWLPDQIAKIPYRKMQELLIIKKQKNETLETQANIAKFKSEHQGIILMKSKIIEITSVIKDRSNSNIIRLWPKFYLKGIGV